jgi:peptide/nickel transport system substrate-binding protein
LVAFDKKKAKRIFRSRRRQVNDMTDTATSHIDRHIFRRMNNFADVGRFMVAWLMLVVILIGGVAYQSRGLAKYYLSNQGIDGGVLSEGMIGSYTTPSPLFAVSTVDLTVSRLLFSSILTYDDHGALVNDLADSVARSDDGLNYSVKLKQGVMWHDGQKFTAKDVVYTYKAIQNIDTKSPYNVSWQGVIISQVDDYTVSFVLPSPLNSFPLSLTNGIVPEHVLSKLSFADLRGSEFNSRPVGTGSFKFSRVVRIDDIQSISKRQRIEMVKNDKYFRGSPKIDAYLLFALKDEADIKEQLRTRQIDAAVLGSNPDSGDLESKYIVTNIPLLAGTYLFFNNQKPPFNTPEFRQALLAGTNTDMLRSKLGYPVQKVESPLLSAQSGYDINYLQNPYNLDAANTALDTQGWLRDPADGNYRKKDGRMLELTLSTLEGSDFAVIASSLQDDWAKGMGIKLNISTKSSADIQPLVLQHAYDMVLYGISVGIDPDVYAYWHSSQAVADRFNMSLYKSDAADRSLESGRTRPDIGLRAAKYKPFLDAWKKDAPAIGLYQPPVFYISRSKVYGFDPARLNSSSDRFYNVQNWQVSSGKRPLL